MTPTRDQELAVLRSVIYASLFDYPLTLDQLQTGLIGVQAEAPVIEGWWHHSALLQATVERRDGWYFPAGRSDLIETRTRREALSRELLRRDQRILSMVSNLPFVRMVALSGSLAHLNAEGSADLDLFVITAPNRVWSVTVITLLLAKLLGWRRRLCLNYVVSEQALTIEPADLFSANQIIHLRPTSGHEVFARFVRTNSFVRVFYPNFEPEDFKTSRPSAGATADKHGLKTLIERALSLGVAQLTEQIARVAYGWHLRRRAPEWQSRDQVKLEAECLKLHTSSHRTSTLQRLECTVGEATATFTKSTTPVESLAS